MHVDDQLTILLTLKDRTPFTFRWMAYADRTRLPFRVLIADGGSDDQVADALSRGTAFPNVNYEYRRYPPDRCYADFYAKVEDALARIQTPLVARGNNDDFFIADGLRAAADFLSGRPDYVTCGGHAAVFWVSSDRGRDGQMPVYGTRADWKCNRDRQTIDDETARGRLRQPVQQGDILYNHVQRTDGLRARFGAARRMNLHDIFLHEQSLAYLAAIAGKTKVLDRLYLAQQRNAPGAGSQQMLQGGDWLAALLAPTWSTDFSTFLTVTAAALAEQDRLPLDEARQFIVKSYRLEMAPAVLASVLKEPTAAPERAAVAWAARRLLGLSAGSPVRRVARALYRGIPWIAVDAVRGHLIGRAVPGAAGEMAPIQRFLGEAPPPLSSS